MWVQQSEGSGLPQHGGKLAAALPLRCLQHAGGGSPPQRPSPIPEQKCGAPTSEHASQVGQGPYCRPYPEHAACHQQKISQRTKAHDRPNVFAPQPLPQDKGILGADGDNEPGTQAKPVSKTGNWKHGACLAQSHALVQRKLLN